MIDKVKEPLQTGGIARDLSFGYIPLLKRFGQNLSASSGMHIEIEAESHKQALNQLLETLVVAVGKMLHSGWRGC